MYVCYPVSTLIIIIVNAQRSDDVWIYDVEAQEWTWIYGSGRSSAPRINYNLTMNVLSTRVVPGGREFHAVFFDIPSNNLYVFGGTPDPFGNQVLPTSTMFRYDIDSGRWAWVSGTRDGVTVIEFEGVYLGSHGARWEEGPEYFPQPVTQMGYYNDHRTRCFYVFGGLYGTNPNLLVTQNFRFNDLWRFNVTSGHWAWLAGSGPGAANSVAIASSDSNKFDDFNVPGARAGCNLAVDSIRGFVYIFGGFGYGVTTPGALNDLWAYDLNKDQFGLLKGAADPTQAVGIYGLKNQHNPRAVPKARWEAFFAIDQEMGCLYMFGGQNYRQGSPTIRVYYMDSWRFDFASSNWAWIAGGSEPDSQGNFGEKNVPRFINNPPGKSAGAYFYDYDKKLFYVHGGRKNPQDEVGNDFFYFIDDVSERLYALSTASVASISRPDPKSFSRRFEGTRAFEPQELSDIQKIFSNPGVVIGIVAGIILLLVAIGLLVWTIRRDKKAGFDSFFANSTKGSTTIADGASTITSSKRRGDKTKTSSDRTRTTTRNTSVMGGDTKTGTVTETEEDNIEVVKPDIPLEIEIDKSKFIVGQKVGSQNSVPIYSGSAVSDELKSFGEHLHIKFYGESMSMVRKSQQQAFWDEVALLNSLKDCDFIARMLGYSVEPTCILIPYYPLGNLEQIFVSKSLTFRPFNILRIALDMARALQVLHNRSLAHRNFKVLFYGFY